MSQLNRTLFCLLLMTTSLWAQTDQTGVIRGKVLDSNNNPLPGAVVSSEQADGSFPKQTVTSANGEYQIGFLKPGYYNLTVTMTGFKTQQVKQVAVNATKVTRQDITLSVDGVAETLVVEVSEPLIDSSSTEYASSLDFEAVDKLPTSRTATDLIAFTPGASNTNVYGGSGAQANSYNLDGVSVNSPGFGGDFLLPNVNWIKEVQVKGLGAGAEYGNFQGGLVNFITKSGSNTFEGNFFTFFETESMNGDNLVPGEAGDRIDTFWDVSLDVSGAFIKDKLYYFVSVAQQERTEDIVDDSNQNEVNFLNDQSERTETKYFSKFTWQATTNDTFNLVLGHDDVETENRGLDSFTEVEASTTQESPATFYNLSWERPISASHFLEVKYTGYDAENNFLPKNGDIPGIQTLDSERRLGQNAPYTRTRDLKSQAFKVSMDAFYNWGSTSHHFKIGAEYDRGEWLETRTRNGGLTWRPIPIDGDSFSFSDTNTWDFISSDWGGDIRLDAENINSAIWIQDYITVNQYLDLSVGVRWGNWEGHLTPGDGSGGQFEAVSDNGIAPRIGAVIDFTGEEDWIAKVHYGRYYQRMFALLYDRVEGGNVFQDTEFWDYFGDPDLNRSWSQSDLPADPDNVGDSPWELFGTSPASTQVGPAVDYSQPYVNQLVIGLEKYLTDDWKVGLTYINRENEDILSLVDLNRDSNYTLFNGVEVFEFPSGDPVLDADGNALVLDNVYLSNQDIIERGWAPGLSDEQVAALSYNPNFVLTNVDEASREFDQFQLVVEGRGDTWDFMASVVSTEIVGNFYTVNGYENTGGAGVGPFVDPNLATNFFGDLENYTELELKLRGSIDLPWNMRLGGFYRFERGEFFTPVFEIDRSNFDFVAADGEFFSPRHFVGINGDPILLERRGSRQLEDFSRLDLNLDKVIEIGASRLVLGVDIFNVFDEDAATNIEDAVNGNSPNPSSQYGAVLGRQAPRIVRFSGSYRW